mmetsp:Transcript_18737/g.41044  ORF Transcript_18737/g.41044 Transcript_18737/m.41044 type:complete len:105 (-) Transcript_18737:150-464(-)|eukprot:CAMPEP_0118926330 /NCGR_PEP_ID=MMETSP1169-20130426/4046_1 /TAXON_ID=36882 /ORGANISM="Pyramimonas obovata, Strain CCMP722" /LENGTH=104 /DNA_ID=CAMNT_0006867861 /DNA_START=102 /DNA_END=416 /DNA_ORIENTATION=-
MATAGLKQFYAARRAPDSRAGQKSATEPAPRIQEEISTDSERIDSVLKAFDLCPKYGPCAGVSRLERWDRANKFGLNPPLQVREIIKDLPSDDPRLQSLWEGRL